MSGFYHQHAATLPIAAIDLEMTGLDPKKDRICEIAVVRRHIDGTMDTWQRLVKSDAKMSVRAFQLHGITQAELATAPIFGDLAEELIARMAGFVLVGHHIDHDISFLHQEFARISKEWQEPLVVDTLTMARRLFAFPRNNLAAVCEYLGVTTNGQHRALSDARSTLGIWEVMLGKLDHSQKLTLQQLSDLLESLAPQSSFRLEQRKQLKQACEHRRTVFIDYATVDDSGVRVDHREIGIWLVKLPYLQGWCYLREEERVFRLDRIRAVTLGERQYSIPKFERKI